MAKLSKDNYSALEMLKKSRLLSTLPEESLQSLVPFFKVKRYPEQTELLQEDSDSAEVYFLIRGKVAIYSNGNLIYKLRRLGDMFGDMSFITDKKCFAKEVADRVIFMDHGAIVEEGTPEHFFTSPTHERTKLFLSQIL